MSPHFGTDDADLADTPFEGESLPLNPPVLDMGASHGSSTAISALPHDLPDLDLTEVAPTPAVQHAPVLRETCGGKTVMPSGWSITGDIESQSDMQIGCQIMGAVSMLTPNRLEVLHGAKVVGTIKALDLVVRGVVEGEIDVSGGSVSIEDGATIRGKVTYTGIRMEGGEHQMELVHVPRSKVESPAGR